MSVSEEVFRSRSSEGIQVYLYVFFKDQVLVKKHLLFKGYLKKQLLSYISLRAAFYLKSLEQKLDQEHSKLFREYPSRNRSVLRVSLLNVETR